MYVGALRKVCYRRQTSRESPEILVVYQPCKPKVNKMGKSKHLQLCFLTGSPSANSIVARGKQSTALLLDWIEKCKWCLVQVQTATGWNGYSRDLCHPHAPLHSPPFQVSLNHKL